MKYIKSILLLGLMTGASASAAAVKFEDNFIEQFIAKPTSELCKQVTAQTNDTLEVAKAFLDKQNNKETSEYQEVTKLDNDLQRWINHLNSTQFFATSPQKVKTNKLQKFFTAHNNLVDVVAKGFFGRHKLALGLTAGALALVGSGFLANAYYPEQAQSILKYFRIK